MIFEWNDGDEDQVYMRDGGKVAREFLANKTRPQVLAEAAAAFFSLSMTLPKKRDRGVAKREIESLSKHLPGAGATDVDWAKFYLLCAEKALRHIKAAIEEDDV